MLARFGNDGNVLNMGDYNMKFVVIGTVVGYAIIVPAILCTYLMQPPKMGSRKKKSVNARPLILLCLGPFSSLPCHINCYILART